MILNKKMLIVRPHNLQHAMTHNVILALPVNCEGGMSKIFKNLCMRLRVCLHKRRNELIPV